MKNTEQSLKSILDERKATFEQTSDERKKKAWANGFKILDESGILNKAINVGDTAPNFMLNNALGKPVELYEYLKKGKVILTWYRGGWCPYCNLTLRHLQMELPQFRKYGANLLALTPELPDRSLTTSEKNNLEFDVLSDIGNKIAKEYGIVFKLSDEVAEYYHKSMDLEFYNGDQSDQLPLATTYIINESGEIIYAFLDVDYRKRAEPSEITEFLKRHN